MNASVHQNVLPSFTVVGAVLDVGCADGSTLVHPAYARASRRCGVDVDRDAIARGNWRYPGLELSVASAEDLPYPDESFDLVISKVALPYTDIRKALREIHRVLKPGGELLITMHDWRMQWVFFKAGGWKRKLDHLYICLASLVYLTTGYVIPRTNGTRETVQTAVAMRRDLMRSGFTRLSFERTQRDWIVTAQRP